MLGELGVDNFGVLKCELLGDRTTAWFGGGLLVDVFEDPEPVAAVLARVVNSGDQLPISAVLGSLPISHFAYSAPCFQYPRSVHYRRSTTRLSQPSSYQLFSHFPYYPLYPSTLKSINYPPPDYLSSDQPSTDICYLSPLSYNNCGHHRSLPHTTSYFRLIGSHDHRVLRLVSSRSPSSFNLDRSFLFR